MSNRKMIGYLCGSFPQGEVPSEFLKKIIELQQQKQEGGFDVPDIVSRVQHTMTWGHHTCEYCFPGGDEELNEKIETSEIEPSEELFENVLSSGDYFLGEYMWPDMLLHYIHDHNYLPPQDFIDFIMKQ